MGTPSGPAGHLPYKAEEFCLQTDKPFAAIDFKSVAAYQRGSIKTVPHYISAAPKCASCAHPSIDKMAQFVCFHKHFMTSAHDINHPKTRTVPFL